MKRWIAPLFVLVGVFCVPRDALGAASFDTQDLVGYWHYKAGVGSNVWRNISPAYPLYNGTVVDTVLKADGMAFNGNASRVRFPSVNISNQSFTIDSWVRYPSTLTSGYLSIANTPRPNENKLGLFLTNRSIHYSLGSERSFTSPSPAFSGDVYNHFAFVYNHSTQLESIYINGSLYFSKRATSPGRWDTAFSLGFDNSQSDLPHDKTSFRIFKRALSSSDISSLYALGAHEIGMEIPSGPLPAVTRFVSTTQTNTSVTLQWDAQPEADQYILSRDGAEIKRSNTSSFVDTGLTKNTAYRYELWSVNSFGQRSPVSTLNVATKNADIRTQLETFESPPAIFPNTGDWIRTTLYKSSGSYSLKSKAITNNQTSTHRFTLDVPSDAIDPTFSFHYRVSSEDGYDWFRVRDNGALLMSQSGERTGTPIYPLTPGTHTIEFLYSKDPSDSGGVDAAFIDDLTLSYTIPEPVRTWSLTPPASRVSFPSVTLDGHVHELPFTLPPLTMMHTGANTTGWKVYASATPFRQVNGSRQHSLSPDLLRFKGVESLRQTGGGTSSLPNATGGERLLNENPTEIIRASSGGGEGTFEATFPPDALLLSIDTTQLDLIDPTQPYTRYESTITWSMSVGP